MSRFLCTKCGWTGSDAKPFGHSGKAFSCPKCPYLVQKLETKGAMMHEKLIAELEDCKDPTFDMAMQLNDKAAAALREDAGTIAELQAKLKKAEELCKLGITRMELCLSSFEGCNSEHLIDGTHQVRLIEVPSWIKEMREALVTLKEDKHE